MRYRLRTLLILAAIGPPLLVGARHWYLNLVEQQEISKKHAEGHARKLKLLDEAEPGVYFLGQNKALPPPAGGYPIRENLDSARQAAIAKSKELGAPQPLPLPPGYGELPNEK